MNLTDEELAMLEQLTYLDSKVAGAAGDSGAYHNPRNYEGRTVGDLLSGYGEDELATLREHTDAIDGAVMTGPEWAEIIEYLQNSEMKDLKIGDIMKDGSTNLAISFTDPSNSSNGYVAFKGTSGGTEWADNVEGLNEADTKCQQDALAFVNGLNYSNITVCGHSKGSNKAMYVTILCDRVTRCVGMDGQGFSQEFIDKYWEEINEKAGCITNYSVSVDYVHALLHQIPGSSQKYVIGYNMDNAAQYHSPNSFFATDEDGNLLLDADGNPIWYETSENENIGMIRDFVSFIMQNASDEDKTMIIDYLGGLMGIIFSASKDEIIDYLFSDTDSMTTIIAYLVDYMEYYHLDNSDINGMLEMMGLDRLNDLFVIDVPVFGELHINLEWIIDQVRGQLTDGKDDLILRRVVFPALQKLVPSEFHVNLSEMWTQIDSKVTSFKPISSTASLEDGHKYDFSVAKYNEIMTTISEIERVGDLILNSWENFSDADWYSELHISNMISGINDYFTDLDRVTSKCKTRVNRVFHAAAAADSKAGDSLKSVADSLKGVRKSLKEIASSMPSGGRISKAGNVIGVGTFTSSPLESAEFTAADNDLNDGRFRDLRY